MPPRKFRALRSSSPAHRARCLRVGKFKLRPAGSRVLGFDGRYGPAFPVFPRVFRLIKLRRYCFCLHTTFTTHSRPPRYVSLIKEGVLLTVFSPSVALALTVGTHGTWRGHPGVSGQSGLGSASYSHSAPRVSSFSHWSSCDLPPISYLNGFSSVLLKAFLLPLRAALFAIACGALLTA